MTPRRTLALLAAAAAVTAAAAPTPASAATWRACRGADAANGITAVRALRVPCASALRVARRTNSVKCFLNAPRCSHRYNGRTWTCRLVEQGGGRATVTCRAGRLGARYRLG